MLVLLENLVLKVNLGSQVNLELKDQKVTEVVVVQKVTEEIWDWLEQKGPRERKVKKGKKVQQAQRDQKEILLVWFITITNNDTSKI